MQYNSLYDTTDLKTLKILNVFEICGNKLNSRWRRINQIIETDKGFFIDNAVRKLDGMFGKVPHGHDWKKEIGKTITEFEVVIDMGYPWLKKI
ncbi:MAG: hypothetical protein IKQ66_01045 [Treponema sp.]|nr:hypothetical protein [Treponema sp.]